MPWVNLHPLYSSRITKSKRWIARKAVVMMDNGAIHDPNLHPHYEASDAPLYPWTSSTFPRPKGSVYDEQLQVWVKAKFDTQQDADEAEGNQYGFRDGVEPIYGPERPRSNLHLPLIALDTNRRNAVINYCQRSQAEKNLKTQSDNQVRPTQVP
ncbi:hypothetical protein BT69DRAFT_1306225 [Atractiella rhizophila]|nr:hypothetical protein BT69DRAFT_1306225 [Atractiella rhizophila]